MVKKLVYCIPITMISSQSVSPGTVQYSTSTVPGTGQVQYWYQVPASWQVPGCTEYTESFPYLASMVVSRRSKIWK